MKHVYYFFYYLSKFVILYSTHKYDLQRAIHRIDYEYEDRRVKEKEYILSRSNHTMWKENIKHHKDEDGRCSCGKCFIDDRYFDLQEQQ
jgi:hypothetical protein